MRTLKRWLGEPDPDGRSVDADASDTDDVASRYRILMVDDDERDAVLLKSVLERVRETSYELEWVSSHAEAIATMKRRAHDAYLIDHRLGGTSGTDLVREAIGLGCRGPLIMLTGVQDPVVDRRALEAGAADFLVKGEASPAVLDRTLRYTIVQAQAREALRQSSSQVLALDEVGRLLADRGPTPELLDSVAGVVAKGFGYERVALYIKEGDALVLEAQRGYARPVREIDPGSGAIDVIMKSGRPSFVPNVSSSPRTGEGGSELCIPLMVGSTCHGLMNIGADEERPLGHVEHVVILAIAERIAGALEIADQRVNRRPGINAVGSQRGANDPETGLLTRQAMLDAFEHRLAVHRSIALTSDYDVAAIVGTVTVAPEDRSQLAAGLRLLADEARSSFGPDSLVGRFAETELAVVIDGVSEEEAAIRAEHWLDAVRAALAQTRPEGDAPWPKMMFSAGSTSARGSTAKAGLLVAAAEMAERVAQRTGEGAVVAA